MNYRSHLLYDQLTHSNSKEHMSNSTKGIVVATDFMITCPLDHLRGHTSSIPWDILKDVVVIFVISFFSFFLFSNSRILYCPFKLNSFDFSFSNHHSHLQVLSLVLLILCSLRRQTNHYAVVNSFLYFWFKS